jgi:hypothetical protein
LDGNNQNNSLNNLEWCNNSQNQLHAYTNGLNKQQNGENHHRSLLTNKQVLEIRALSGTITQREIGKIYGVSRAVISKIMCGDNYKYI